ncbi:MAG TPA: hypothetical protein VGO86_11170 [Candidatus Dormibacteraeota bacterium]
MLEDIAAYLTLAPLAGSLVLAAMAVAFWLRGRRPAPARVRVRIQDRR